MTIVYVDEIAMSPVTSGIHWVQYMIQEKLVIKPTGILKYTGDTIQVLGRVTSMIDGGLRWRFSVRIGLMSSGNLASHHQPDM